MTDAAIALELRRLADEVAAQRDELAELRRCLLDKADRRTGARLVPALARLLGDAPFTAAGAAAAALNATGPAAGVVRDALADAADADGGLRGFGSLLRRLEGAPFGRLRLVRVGGSGDALRWRVAGLSAE